MITNNSHAQYQHSHIHVLVLPGLFPTSTNKKIFNNMQVTEIYGLKNVCMCLVIMLCNTFIPQIKGKCQYIKVILHWLWNVNDICTDISAYIYFSPFCSPVKEKGKQGRMKGLTMAQWINTNQNNRSLLAHQHSVLWEKTGFILLPLVGLSSGSCSREAGQQTKYGGFWFFKIVYRLNYSGFLFCLLSLLCYYSNRTAFQSAFFK